MTKEYYLSDDFITKNGIVTAIDEIMNQINCSSIEDMFYGFETIHEILVKYEIRAKNRIREQIKDQCEFRYKQYKKDITDNIQFLTADVIRSILAKNAFGTKKGYGLCCCIENAYLNIDFIMRTIAEHIVHVKNSPSKYFKIKKYCVKAVMIENDKGLSFVLDKETNQGFIGYIKGSVIMHDRTKTVSDDEYWEFAKARNRDGVTYELL